MPERLDTLDLICRRGFNLYLRCPCGRESVFDARQLLMWCGTLNWPTVLPALLKRMPCSICGRRLTTWGAVKGRANVDLADYAEQRIRKLETAADKLRIFMRSRGKFTHTRGPCPRCGKGEAAPP